MTREAKTLIIVAIFLALFYGMIITFSVRESNNNKLVYLSERASFLNSTILIKEKVKGNIEEMIQDAEKDGMCLVVISGYRTEEQQRLIYNTAKDKSMVALPGTSEHEQGIAIDLGGCPMNDKGARDDNENRIELKNKFSQLPEYQWLINNASRYGFEQSYTERDKNGLPAEEWHWRYIY